LEQPLARNRDTGDEHRVYAMLRGEELLEAEVRHPA